MASIFKRPSGTWTVEIYLDSKRKTKIGLSTKSQREAGRIADRIQSIVDSKKSGVENSETVSWLMKVREESPNLYRKLVTMGLVSDLSGGKSHTIREVSETYIKEKNLALATIRMYSSAIDLIEEFFGKGFNIRSITKERAVDFFIWLNTPEARKLGAGTMVPISIHRRLSQVKTIFRYAVKLEWIDKNPFEDTTISASVDQSRWHYVPTEIADKVLSAARNPKYAAIFALGRYAGVRGVSELIDLRWSAIHFPDGQMGLVNLRAPKVKGYSTEYRVVPMSKILFTYLRRWKDCQTKVSELVFPGLSPNFHAWKMAHSLIAQAGLELWVNPWYNLRKSFCSDVMESGADPRVYQSITGHSWEIGMKYYQILHPDRKRRGYEQVLRFFEDESGDKSGDDMH